MQNAEFHGQFPLDVILLTQYYYPMSINFQENLPRFRIASNDLHNAYGERLR